MAKRVICLGDSITEGVGDNKGIGWPGRLGAHVQALKAEDEWRIINAGVAGDTSVDIYHRLLSEVGHRAPVRLIIAAGVNDTGFRLWPDAKGQKIDTSYARQVWTNIINILKNQVSIKTIFLSPLPVDESRLPLVYMPCDELDRGTDFSNTRIRHYIGMQKQVVESNGFIYVDVFSEWLNLPFHNFLGDGLHPNSSGYDVLSESIIGHLDSLDFWID